MYQKEENLTENLTTPMVSKQQINEENSSLFMNVILQKDKNEDGNLKSETCEDYSQKPQQNCTFMNSRYTTHIQVLPSPPPPTLNIPQNLVSFSPKLCTVHQLQLTIEKMFVCEISYSAVPMKTRTPAGEFVSINYSTVCIVHVLSTHAPSRDLSGFYKRSKRPWGMESFKILYIIYDNYIYRCSMLC